MGSADRPEATGGSWHSLEKGAVLDRLRSSAEGLAPSEAAARLAREGSNSLRERAERPWWSEVLEELAEPMIVLLLAIGVLYSIWGELEDAVTIFSVILALVAVEVYNDLRAEKAIEALNKLSEPTATVRRGGKDVEVRSEDIVPGDILVLEAGRRVPADARLLESFGLAVDEAPLTGESSPQEKAEGPAGEDAPLVERTSMVYSGTVVTRGRGSAAVVATGDRTELGRIAGLARREKPPRTVLQRTMSDLTKWMVLLALGFSIVVPLLGWLINGQSAQEMLLTGLSLAFATIPEELPIIITMVLGLGGYRLSRQNAIIKRLHAVETLGAITVICTDKTGTLTTNRMEVMEIYPLEREARLLHAGVMANDARRSGDSLLGDPVDIALVREAERKGMGLAEAREAGKIVNEFSFDNLRKRMSVVYLSPSGLMAAVKGSPESILERSAELAGDGGSVPITEEDRAAFMSKASDMAARGLRVLAVAERRLDGAAAGADDIEAGLTLIGLVGLADPPRPEAREAVEACRRAGIRVMMITGDHPLTALSVARQVGLAEDGAVLTGGEIDRMGEEELQEAVKGVDIIARATPEHKLLIVKALRANGERIAVTGDGINDAPALSSADIGIAMGQGGTDVARESADMILANNNFATIAGAVKEGRVLFSNLSKGVRYYLACKVALITVSLIGVLFRLPIPFSPVQIIIMELFMDLGASAAFVAERSEGDLMHRPPRDPRARFMDRRMVASIFAASAGLILAVAGAYLIGWYGSGDLTLARTMALVTWLVGHVLLALNMRSERQPLLEMGAFSNRTMVIWGAAAGIFAVAATTLTPLFDAINTTSLSLANWAIVIALAVAGSFWMEAYKLLSRKAK